MYIEKGKIGVRQFGVLLIMFTLGGSVLVKPAAAAFIAKQDGWLAAIVSLIGGILLIMLYNKLSTRFPNKTLVQYSQDVLGKWIGGTISFLYFLLFFLLTALTLRSLGEFLTTEILPNTPIQVIHILFLLTVIMGIRNGIEVFTRSAEIFLPWTVLLFLTLFLVHPSQLLIDHIQPILGYGFKPVLRASIPFLSTPYMELVIFLMIFPFVNHSQKVRNIWLIGVLIAGIMLILISLLSILVLGADLTGRLLYPTYNLAEKVSIGHFAERLEILMAGIWFITIYFKLAICFYVATMIFAELFHLREARPLYAPFGMLLIPLSIIIFPNTVFILSFVSKTYIFYVFPYAVIFPLLILIVAMIRKKAN